MLTSLICLTSAVFFEARDQSYDAQTAVANVVMNRVESPRWPDTICGVVYQRKAFSFTHDGMSDDLSDYSNSVLDVQAAVIAKEIARNTIRGDRLGIPSTHYHATYIRRPYWAPMYDYDGRVGGHLFYTAPAGL
jgi:spore germination cell wall hydrolase CwlJ-like protein